MSLTRVMEETVSQSHLQTFALLCSGKEVKSAAHTGVPEALSLLLHRNRGARSVFGWIATPRCSFLALSLLLLALLDLFRGVGA